MNKQGQHIDTFAEKVQGIFTSNTQTNKQKDTNRYIITHQRQPTGGYVQKQRLNNYSTTTPPISSRSGKIASAYGISYGIYILNYI